MKDVKKEPIPYHIALAFENKKLLCWAINMPTIHAETNLLRKLQYMQTKHKVKWERINMIVVRVRIDSEKNFYFSMSKPCVHCTNELQKTKIKKVFWSTNNGDFDVCKLCNLQTKHVSRFNRF